MKNRKWTFYSPIYVHRKKHYCIFCNKEMNVKRVKKTVNSKSPEAKDFDFSCAGGEGGSMFGEVEFHFEVFHCPDCEIEIPILELKRYERKLKRMAKRRKDAVKSLYKVSSIYVRWKKHVCPNCGTKMNAAYDSVIINADSPEAGDYDRSIAAGDSGLTDDIEFRASYFMCPTCKFSIPCSEMKKLEK